MSRLEIRHGFFVSIDVLIGWHCPQVKRWSLVSFEVLKAAAVYFIIVVWDVTFYS
jgi:hypothetical protein